MEYDKPTYPVILQMLCVFGLNVLLKR